MANRPFHHSSDHGVPFTPVAATPPAGLRFLLAGHRDLSRGPLPFVIAARLAVAIGCFAGGFVCAQAFVECLGSPSATCSSVTALPPGFPGLAIAILPACAALRLFPAVSASARRGFLHGLRQSFPTYKAGINHG